ncbi:hypothetical protein [Streptomyces sp. NPDC029003]|uniref:hypothetical protein n=1 Tax=Streptomyces sp. NPDC029003 TaxID=3155125 RepID=UPI0033F5853B
MQLRRAALPLSLLALLASAGCVSVGPESGGPGPARGSVPPLDAPDAPDASDAPGAPPGQRAAAPPAPLPLGELPDPEPPSGAPDPDPAAARKARPPGERAGKPAVPRRARPLGPAPPHTPHAPRPAGPRPLRGEELCAAAEGALPPSVVDLCVRQYGR